MLPAEAERVARDLSKWRTIFCAIAIVVPALLFTLFERQARRLDALGARGVVTSATVTAVTRQGGVTYVDYAYEVRGKTYTWNVSRDEAPYSEGETFPIVVSPDDPTLSRPGTDPSRGNTEALKNRAFAKKAVGAVLAFFVICALACHLRLARLRKTGRTEADDPQAYRNRLLFGAAMLAPFLIAMLLMGIDDARAKGESMWPGIVGVGLGVAILGATAFYALREGRANVNRRVARALRWAVPLSIGIAIVRVVILALAKD